MGLRDFDIRNLMLGRQFNNKDKNNLGVLGKKLTLLIHMLILNNIFMMFNT